MYLERLLHTLAEAASRTFDAEYPTEDFRDLHVSLEWPQAEEHFPGIWVDFEPVGEVRIAGIGHTEWTPAGDGGGNRKVKRWLYQGFATYTVVALSSLERARLTDEMVRVIAFGQENAQTSEFRTFVENNEFLVVHFDWDEVGVSGFAATPGTDWGSNDVVYEATIRLECHGEFVSDALGTTLVPLTGIEIHPYVLGEEPPAIAYEDGWT